MIEYDMTCKQHFPNKIIDLHCQSILSNELYAEMLEDCSILSKSIKDFISLGEEKDELFFDEF